MIDAGASYKLHLVAVGVHARVHAVSTHLRHGLFVSHAGLGGLGGLGDLGGLGGLHIIHAPGISAHIRSGLLTRHSGERRRHGHVTLVRIVGRTHAGHLVPLGTVHGTVLVAQMRILGTFMVGVAFT